MKPNLKTLEEILEEKKHFKVGQQFLIKNHFDEENFSMFTIEKIEGNKVSVAEEYYNPAIDKNIKLIHDASIEKDGIGLEFIRINDSVLDANECYEENDRYTRSSTAGDYGPSNPWDAPGMSISDFI